MKAAWMLLTAVKWGGECHLSAPCGLLAAYYAQQYQSFSFRFTLTFFKRGTGEFGSVFVANGAGVDTLSKPAAAC